MSTSSTLRVKSFVLPPPLAAGQFPFHVAAKRYWTEHSEAAAGGDRGSVTLIALHSTSFHKETWEPTLETLFGLQDDLLLARQPAPVAENAEGHRTPTPTSAYSAHTSTSASPPSHPHRGHGPTTRESPKTASVIIRDVWAIDCPNHGESAHLNRRPASTARKGKHLDAQPICDFSCERYAEAVHRFLSSGIINLDNRRLVGLGHSLGANAMLILQTLRPHIPFESLIILEPMVSAIGTAHLADLRGKLVKSAQRRKYEWDTKEDARRDMTVGTRAKWDRRVAEAFVNHAIEWCPTRRKYTLSCTPEQEVAMYLDENGPTLPVGVLNKVCHEIPVHLILGDVPDFIPKHVHQALIDPSSGRVFASLNIMPDVGHLLPQERPTEVASHLFDILTKTGRRKSRL